MMEFVDFLVGFASSLGYLGIFLLMVVESSFVPFPSEAVILPAALAAAHGVMNIYLVVFFGVLGSLVGALINYFLAMWLGRPLVMNLVESRYAKWFLLSRAKVEKSESWFLKYGGISTFVGRLVPVVRQLISLPAGFSKMKIAPFIIYTTSGALIWVVALAMLGYLFGIESL